MAILINSSRTKFPSFGETDPKLGIEIEEGIPTVLEFLRRINVGWENQYVDQGSENIPGFSTSDRTYAQIKKPSKRHVYSQAPRATVLVKKRMFSALRTNYDPRFMNENEKIFIRASKILFDKKCQDIAFYENLSNVKSSFNESGFLNIESFTNGVLDSFLSILEKSFLFVDFFGANTRDALRNFASQEFSESSTQRQLQGFSKVLEQLLTIREKDRRAKSNPNTTWIYDQNSADTYGLGVGVGVIELNQISDISTSVALSGGSAKLTIQDPYRMMVITDVDIEMALRQAITENGLKNLPVSNDSLVSKIKLETIKAADIDLNKSRRARGLSEINFEYNAIQQKTLGFVISSKEEFDKFSISSISQENSLNRLESSLASNIFNLMEDYQAMQDRVLDKLQLINRKYNSVRQRLRNEFVGHSIIQQMDSVHIFMNSNTRDETSSKDSPNTVNDLYSAYANFQRDTLDIATIKLEHEEIAPDVPFILYFAMRDKSSFRSDGVQIFSGLVSGVNSSYEASSGSFTTSVDCKDNREFLTLGRLNVDPSMAQVKGILYDPITPFDISTSDSSKLVSTTPVLSDANLKRIQYLRFHDGLYSGEKVTSKNIMQDSLMGGKVLSFQHVPGLIYEWKKGIVAETLNINMRQPLNGKGNSLSDVIEIYGVTSEENPFGGLDSADVISILVTGRPYNYSSFLKHAIDAGSFSVDPSNQGKTYFNYLFDILERQSSVKGNFIPAVASPIDPLVASSIYREKMKLEGFNRQLLAKRRRYYEIQSKKASGTDLELTNLKTQIEDDAFALSSLASEAAYNANNLSPDLLGKVSLGAVGNEFHVSFDENQLDESRKKIKYKLKKKPEDVRYNVDQNYLVVSEQYDSDTDIQNFARNLKRSAADQYNSTYKSPLDICEDASKAIGFEFFADSQGNLVFRPPQYNRTPLSLLLRLVMLNRTEGVNYAPDFINDLIKTRLETIEENIFIKDLMILEKICLLGYPVSMANFSSVGSSNGVELSIYGDESGVFLQDRFKLIKSSASNDEFTFRQQSEAVRFYGKSLVKSIFEKKKSRVAASGGSLLLSDEVPDEVPDEASEDTTLKSTVELLISTRNELNSRLGNSHKIKSIYNKDDIKEAEDQIAKQTSSPEAQLNRLNAVEAIAKLVSERRVLIKSFAAAFKNAEDLKVKKPDDDDAESSDLPNPNSEAAKKRLFGEFQVFPKFMEYMIENDLSNEDGWMSGRRFIVEDDVLINTSLSVKTPDFNMVEVIGNQDLLRTQDGSLAGIPYSLWAGAVDYDSWRKFGLKTSGSQIFRADFTSPEQQCAPYAVFKLLEQRAKIHAGSITVMGNEFYQVGDVIYLNMNNMLYYVVAVEHSFSFSSAKFTTRLVLEYGRALGEYIPTPLDVIGKGLLSSSRKYVGNVKAVRTAVPMNHVVHLDTFHVPGYDKIAFREGSSIDKDKSSSVNGSIEKAFTSNEINKAKAQKIISIAGAYLNKAKQGLTRVDVRTYYIDGVEDSDLLKKRAEKIGRWVKDLLTLNIGSETGGLEINDVQQIRPINISPAFEPSLREKELMFYPTAQAWAGNNPFVNSKDGVGLPVDAVDVMMVFEKGRYGDISVSNFEGSNGKLIDQSDVI